MKADAGGPAVVAGSTGTVVAYLTPGEVAAMLQISIKSVYRWAAQDPTMPALRIGGTVRFPRERLERWLRDREQGAPRMRRQVLSVAKPSKERESAGA
jgi:excisionase family DNA binding protein